MEISVASVVASCSVCGEPLTAKGDCVACLLRTGLDESVVEEKAPASLVFGDFEIVRHEDGSFCELGRGAMGVTYLARDNVLRRKVALKVIDVPAAARGSQRVRERFLREARAAAALRHPNVAAVFQFGASPDGSRCYYAMELVEGETLEDRVRRDGPLKAKLVLEIAIQISRALTAAAAHSLIHRDLKPANMMLTKSDADTVELEVKVIDFGLAKAIADAGREMDQTHEGFVGTPSFASPEQFESGPVDVRSDIYSLGATLWFALTGKTPFGGRNIEGIRHAQKSDALPIEQLKTARVPSRMRSLLKSMLAIEPAARPGVKDLAAELRRCSAQANAGGIRGIRSALAGAVSLILAVSVFFALHSRETGPRPVATVENSVSNPAVPEKSIAVLPFENLSNDREDASFADGVQDDILTKLAAVSDLKVISRTSVMQYRGDRNTRQIGEALRVSHVLEGSVRKTGAWLHINAQLVDTRTDTHVWAEQYDRDLKDIFAIQSEIAQKIAAQLKVALSPKEQEAIKARPTQDMLAYDFYLRAKEIERAVSGALPEKLNEKVLLLDQAVARDPAFVPALCLLARAHLEIYWFNLDHSEARLNLAGKALDAAARAQPEAGEVHLARAVRFYWVNRDYVSALAELALARRSLPNDADLLQFLAFIERRQGQWDESIRHLEEARTIDPRNAATSGELAFEYVSLRRYTDAARAFEEVLVWKPDDFTVQLGRALVDMEAKGDLRRLESIIFGKSAKAGDAALLAAVRIRLALWQRNYHAAEQALFAYSSPDITERGYVTPREFFTGMIFRGQRESARAQAAFLAARDRAAAIVAERPDDAKALIILAEIDARLGRKAEAIRAGEEAIKLLPVNKDAFDGPDILARLAGVLAQVGETSRALDLLERVLKTPSAPSLTRPCYGRLKMDDVWDPLRGDPRFEKIVASLAPKGN
jgi:serine/threonine protein kinase/tetratricopeptide (TPR) repeat protein